MLGSPAQWARLIRDGGELCRDGRRERDRRVAAPGRLGILALVLRAVDTSASPDEALSAAEMAYRVIQVERDLTMRLAAILDAEECSVDRWCALLLLADGQGHAMSELIAHTLLPPATVTRLVDGMLVTGLAYRRVDERDRRRVLVFATERGHALHARLSAQIEEDRHRLFPTGMPDVTLRALAGVETAIDE